MVTGLHRWCPLPPHPNPSPRRGEGRLGVMVLMSFLQCLGLLRGYICLHPPFRKAGKGGFETLGESPLIPLYQRGNKKLNP